MKYVRQFSIIAGVTFLGEVLRYFVPLPIPASVWGLVLMLTLLIIKLIKLEDIKETSDFLINIMPLMFVPAAVGLIVSWQRLGPIIIPVNIIVAVTTVCVLVVSGRSVQFIMRKKENKDE